MYEIEKENWKKTLQVKGLEEKQFKNYRICLEPKKVYDEKFLNNTIFLLKQKKEIFHFDFFLFISYIFKYDRFYFS